MRNVQGGRRTPGTRVWDVTDVKKPVLASALQGIRSTHKLWWECNSGIAYHAGQQGRAGARHSMAPDRSRWSSTTGAIRTRPLRFTSALSAWPGHSQARPEPVPPSLHGPISAHEHPNAANKLGRGATADDIIGNRIYSAWGVGDDGVLTIMDRKKLLPPLSGGTWRYLATANPDAADGSGLGGAAEPGSFYMSPDQGGHTSMPVFGLKPASYQAYTEFQTRDIVLLASEATADLCDEAPHWSFIVDVTVENSKTAPPAPGSSRISFQGPWSCRRCRSIRFEGEKYPRGNYCARGARFGTHSSEENFNNPLYGKLTAIALFTGGVRIWDIREPQAPVEVGFYVPESNANTNPDGYMTNNVEIDDRGFIYVVDRNGAGLDILQLTGKALDIVFPAARPLNSSSRIG